MNAVIRFLRRVPVILGVVFNRFIDRPSQRFIDVYDSVSNRSIKMLLRQDGYIEGEFEMYGLYGGWEKESLRIWAFLATQARVIFDVGANTGTYSLLAKANNPAACVWAIEPIRSNFDVLEENIKENRMDIIIERTALSSQNGTAKMYMIKDQLNYMTSINDNRYSKHPEIVGQREVIEVTINRVTYQTLEEKYQIGKLDLIKLDIEGHEREVLINMQKEIERDRPNILLEVSDQEDAVWMTEYFKSLNYVFISISELNKSKRVERISDNDHHNFLLCDNAMLQKLQLADLVE